ncbi:heparinase II/III domain-containing protein [Sinomicrobium soli]|uniref:heparinase II/III domain-containing protein n=1 Tax=Sinomicrobium sp. N-1-3-6 TaxID=2219864 RepID=UPI000DCE43EC|nr:heparinase II/III family protein [Sinomicrobium sp. N-1-3-6]RAV28195.1 heparinase [Sinomicrobium sp. N-1-3-6]
MKRLLLIGYYAVILSCFMSCGDKSMGDPDPGPDPRPVPDYPEGTFDYEKVAPHPRLMMSEEALEDLEGKVAGGGVLGDVHNYVLQQCDMMVGGSTLTYKKDGKRLLAVSREALKRIFFLSYGYRMTGSQLYLIKAKAELNAVCDFPDWNPTHYLDVGEMTMAVAIGYDWLYDALDEGTRSKIRSAIVEKAFETSKVSSYNWFYDRENNWNQVCNAGLVYGALAILEEEPEASVAIIEKALETNRKVLEIYAPDGNYPEGPGYWAYGTTFQVMMLAALDSAFGNDAGLSDTPGFMASAEYMLYMTGPSGQWFNYSDCAKTAQPLPAMFWYAGKQKNASLLFEEKALLNEGEYFRNFSEERILPLALIYGKDLNLDQLSAPQKEVWSGEGITPVVTVRKGWEGDDDRYVGIKAGEAYTSHGHMDAGAFVYDIGNTRWAVDLGMQSYAAVEAAGVDLWNMDQDSERWDVFRLHNKNHNTITINGQRHNVRGRATVLEVYDTASEKGALLDMTDVLNLSGELVSATRKVTLENGDDLRVVDVLEAGDTPVEVYWNMISPGTADISDESTVTVSSNSKQLDVHVVSDAGFTLETDRVINPSTSYETRNNGVEMFGFRSTVPANTRVTYTVTLKER